MNDAKRLRSYWRVGSCPVTWVLAAGMQGQATLSYLWSHQNIFFISLKKPLVTPEHCFFTLSMVSCKAFRNLFQLWMSLVYWNARPLSKAFEAHVAPGLWLVWYDVPTINIARIANSFTVTLNCQVTIIVGSQLSELYSVSIVTSLQNCLLGSGHVSPHSDQGVL